MKGTGLVAGGGFTIISSLERGGGISVAPKAKEKLPALVSGGSAGISPTSKAHKIQRVCKIPEDLSSDLCSSHKPAAKCARKSPILSLQLIRSAFRDIPRPTGI